MPEPSDNEELDLTDEVSINSGTEPPEETQEDTRDEIDINSGT